MINKNEYIHKILDKYNKHLTNFSVVIEDGKSRREEEYHKIKTKIQKDIRVKEKSGFLIIEKLNNDYQKEKFICYNKFILEYNHHAWLSDVKCYLINIFTNKSVDCSINTLVLKHLPNDVKLKDAICEMLKR